MPNPIPHRIPKYRKHKPSGQAVVTLNGRDHYLGHYGTAASRSEYDRLIAEWTARGRRATPVGQELTVNGLILAYFRFAAGYYKRGSGTSELHCIRDALRIVRRLYGRSPVSAFGPRALKAVRQCMIDKSWCRSHVNHQVNRIRRAFRWGVSEELMPAGIFHALQALPGIRRGMSGVREAEPIRPVPEAHVFASLPHMPPAVATMVQLQLLTGCRPGEICILRPCDLDVSGSVWVYRPQTHKTQHFGKERLILIGPKGQELLKPWLRPELQAYVFAPAEGEEERNAERRRNRQSPMTPSQSRRRRKRNRRRPWGACYPSPSYRRAIERACEKADRLAHEQDPSIPEEQVAVPVWSPNQLRHTRATQLRREVGLELTKTILGHSSLATSEIYAERDLAGATAVMAKIG